MGLYDTFIIDPPIPCPSCGRPVASVQSKSFGSSLNTYRDGDIIWGCDIRLGVVEDTYRCDGCSGRADREDRKIWITAWQGIYAGTFAAQAAAESRLASIDRLTIINWLMRQQDEKENWQRRFSSLYRDIKGWHSYCAAENKEELLAKPFGLSGDTIRECLESADPLAEMLKAYENEGKSLYTDIFE
jgi:hypothetical protein